MKIIAGIILVSIPFIAVTAICVRMMGFWVMVTIYAITAAMVACIAGGLMLIGVS